MELIAMRPKAQLAFVEREEAIEGVLKEEDILLKEGATDITYIVGLGENLCG
jgi:hypothetical protein